MAHENVQFENKANHALDNDDDADQGGGGNGEARARKRNEKKILVVEEKKSEIPF